MTGCLSRTAIPLPRHQGAPHVPEGRAEAQGNDTGRRWNSGVNGTRHPRIPATWGRRVPRSAMSHTTARGPGPQAARINEVCVGAHFLKLMVYLAVLKVSTAKNQTVYMLAFGKTCVESKYNLSFDQFNTILMCKYSLISTAAI